jgi:uncharacterized membrane protein
MGEMMGAGRGNWILLWIFLGIAMVVPAGVAAARVHGTGRKVGQPRFRLPNRQPRERRRTPLWHRYANGEISREEYLHGKVELES